MNCELLRGTCSSQAAKDSGIEAFPMWYGSDFIPSLVC